MITIKDKENLFRLKKENKASKDRTLRDITNVFRPEKKVIKDIILRDIKKRFENEEEENYYKPET